MGVHHVLHAHTRAANDYLSITLFLGMDEGRISIFDEPKATDEAREEVKQNRVFKTFTRVVRAVKKACAFR